MRCTALTKGYETDRVRRMGPRCKRNCADGTDFCKQHNPVNKLDDATCAICLDDIKNPLKLGCAHVFCKECISETVLHRNTRCPCCRATFDCHIIHECLRVRIGQKEADKFKLEFDVAFQPWKWVKMPWTKAMEKQFFAVHSDVNVELWKIAIHSVFYDENGFLKR